MSKLLWSQGSLTVTSVTDLVSSLYVETIYGVQDFTIHLNPTSGNLLLGAHAVLSSSATGYILPPGVDGGYEGAGSWGAWTVSEGSSFSLEFSQPNTSGENWMLFGGDSDYNSMLSVAPASDSATFNYMLFLG